MNCHFCHEPLDPDLAYRRTTGWERKAQGPSRRGGSDIVLREHVDEFACIRCVDRLKMGLSVRQASLL